MKMPNSLRRNLTYVLFLLVIGSFGFAFASIFHSGASTAPNQTTNQVVAIHGRSGRTVFVSPLQKGMLYAAPLVISLSIYAWGRYVKKLP
jgi:hypothetical protein